jgi:hypothetical protein
MPFRGHLSVYTALQAPPLMKAKLFVIILAVMMMIGIAILRSRTAKKLLPIHPGAFEEMQKARRR